MMLKLVISVGMVPVHLFPIGMMHRVMSMGVLPQHVYVYA